jgi:DeoR family transcriptional regulator, fructose operon transcriptional repressor
MFTNERRKNIIEQLKIQSRITVSELTETLSVSEATIRRDLHELQKQGLLKRARGGAIINSPINIEQTFNEKEISSLVEKKYIACIASSFIKDNDVIIMDSGTTTIQMIPFITQKNITVITNSIATAYAISTYSNISLIMIGGQHRQITKAVVGCYANNMLKSLHADKAFIGTNAFDTSFGFSTPNPEEAETKKSMISIADEIFITLDYTKFNKISMVQFANLKTIDSIITDKKINKKIMLNLQMEGVNVFN